MYVCECVRIYTHSRLCGLGAKVYVCEKEAKRETATEREIVCICVGNGAIEREIACVCLCACVCVTSYYVV